MFGFQGLINFHLKKKGAGGRRDKMADWGMYHGVLFTQTSKLIVIDNRAAWSVVRDIFSFNLTNLVAQLQILKSLVRLRSEILWEMTGEIFQVLLKDLLKEHSHALWPCTGDYFTCMHF